LIFELLCHIYKWTLKAEEEADEVMEMAGYPARRACREYWQMHIQAALERGTLPVLLLSNEHFLPKVRCELRNEIRACEENLAEWTAALAQCDWAPLRKDLEILIKYGQEKLAKLQAQLPSKPFRNWPIVPVYPLFVLNAHLQCRNTCRLFAILQRHGVPFYPVKASDGKSIVWVVEASPRLEEVFNSYALRHDRKPLKLTNFAYPLIDICLLPEGQRSLAYTLCAIAAQSCPQWQPMDYLPVSWQGFTLLPWRIVADFAVFSVPKAVAAKAATKPLQALKRLGFVRLTEKVSAWLRRYGKESERFRKGLPDILYDTLFTIKKKVEGWQAACADEGPLFDPTYIIRCAIMNIYRLYPRRARPKVNEVTARAISDRYSAFNLLASAADGVSNYLVSYLRLWSESPEFRRKVDERVRRKASFRWSAEPIPSIRSFVSKTEWQTPLRC
jgi:hypothetical protein